MFYLETWKKFTTFITGETLPLITLSDVSPLKQPPVRSETKPAPGPCCADGEYLILPLSRGDKLAEGPQTKQQFGGMYPGQVLSPGGR